ncbi:MAG: ferritin-like domain-containing protein, partial [Planctomycetota bacterium]
ATRLAEADRMPDAPGMVEELYADLKKLNQWTRETIQVADDARDIGTASMLEDFAVEGEKEAWMLRSFLGKSESVNA